MFYESVSKNELTQFWPIFKRVPNNLLSNLKSFKLMGSGSSFLVDNDNRVYFFGRFYKLFCSGLNPRHQGQNESKPVEILEDIFVKDVVLTMKYILVLDTRGDIYSWGHEIGGLFLVSKRNSKTDKRKCLSANNQFSSLECGNANVVALTNHGSVFCWKEHNQHLIPDSKNELSRVKVKQISCGPNHSLALASSGHLYSWGDNDCGQLAIGRKGNARNPVRNTFNELFRQISAGESHSLLLSSSGQVYGAGNNKDGQVCGSDSDKIYYPQLVSYTKNYQVKAIGAQGDTSVALTSNGKCLVWGEMQNNNRQLKYMVVDLNSIGKAMAQYCPDKDTRHMVTVDGHSFDYVKTNFLKSKLDELEVVRARLRNDASVNAAENTILPFQLEQCSISSAEVCVNPFLSRLHRLFDSGPESDVRFSMLKSDRRPIFVNRWFLQNTSNYFGTMLSDRWLTNSKRDSDGKFMVEIGASSYSVYYSYLAFLYTGELVLRDENQHCEDQVLFELFDLALCNGQSELSQLCIDRLFQPISIENCCELYQIASLYGPQLESEQRTLMDGRIGQFIANNFDSVLRSSQFVSMDSQLCKQLVIQLGTAIRS